MKFLILISIVIFVKIIEIDCHGRLMNPPARSSAWRENPEQFPTVDYDNQMFCGGFETQWKKNKGRCGICGEDWSGKREFEKGGRLYRGNIVRTYSEGAEIEVTAEITANHRGFMDYRICNVDKLAGGEATQKCLNQNLLRDRNGRSRFTIPDQFVGNITTRVLLPKNFNCDHCVIQWRYHAGNSWNKDPISGRSCIGCGPQEEFYGCSDVKVSGSPKREQVDNTIEDDESKYLLLNLIDQLKHLKEQKEKDERGSDSIDVDLEVPKFYEKRTNIVYPDEPRPFEEYGREERVEENPEDMVYPSDPIPSDDISVRDVIHLGRPMAHIVYPDEPRPSEEYKRNVIVYPDEPRPSEEIHTRDVIHVGRPLAHIEDGKRGLIVYPDEPRPSEKIHARDVIQVGRPLAHIEDGKRGLIVYPDEPRPVEEYSGRNLPYFEELGPYVEHKRKTIVYPDEPRPSEEIRFKRKLLNLLRRRL